MHIYCGRHCAFCPIDKCIKIYIFRYLNAFPTFIYEKKKILSNEAYRYVSLNKMLALQLDAWVYCFDHISPVFLNSIEWLIYLNAKSRPAAAAQTKILPFRRYMHWWYISAYKTRTNNQTYDVQTMFLSLSLAHLNWYRVVSYFRYKFIYSMSIIKWRRLTNGYVTYIG